MNPTRQPENNPPIPKPKRKRHPHPISWRSNVALFQKPNTCTVNEHKVVNQILGPLSRGPYGVLNATNTVAHTDKISKSPVDNAVENGLVPSSSSTGINSTFARNEPNGSLLGDGTTSELNCLGWTPEENTLNTRAAANTTLALVSGDTTSWRLKGVLKIAADRSAADDALLAFDPQFYGDVKSHTDNSRIKAYTLFCQHHHSKSMTPLPVTYFKIAAFVATLITKNYKTADDYLSAVRVFAKSFDKWQLASHEELVLSLNMSRAARRGCFQHSPAVPAILSDFVCTTLSTCRAIGLFCFYFGLRRNERYFIDILTDVTITPITGEGQEKSVKIALSLEKYKLKSNHTKVVTIYCICDQLARTEGTHICPCKLLPLLRARGNRVLSTYSAEELLQECGLGTKTHSFRIGTLHHLIASEAEIGWGAICNHLRWAGVAMLLYYMRQRAKTRFCGLRKINFLSPHFEQCNLTNKKILQSVSTRVDQLVASINDLRVDLTTPTTTISAKQSHRISTLIKRWLDPQWPETNAPAPDAADENFDWNNIEEQFEDFEDAHKKFLQFSGENWIPLDDSERMIDDGGVTPEF